MKFFTQEEIGHIKEGLGIKTGSISLVTDYESLRTGDVVLVSLTDSHRGQSIMENITKGTIFLYSGVIYIIQNSHDGNRPGGDWQQYGYGHQAWKVGSDHRKLHYYRESTSELGYDEGDDPKNWNLPMSGSSIKGGYPSDSMLNKSNFCVVFNLYEFMNKPNKKRYEIKNKRKEEKRGASIFMSDDEIKDIRVNDYLTKILNNMGITIDPSVSEMKNLNSVIKKPYVLNIQHTL